MRPMRAGSRSDRRNLPRLPACSRCTKLPCSCPTSFCGLQRPLCEHRTCRDFPRTDGCDRIVWLLDQRCDQPAQERVARPGRDRRPRSSRSERRWCSPATVIPRSLGTARLDDDAARPARPGLGQRRLDERPLAAAVLNQVRARGQVAAQIEREGVWVALDRPNQLLVRPAGAQAPTGWRSAAGRTDKSTRPKSTTLSWAASSATPREPATSYRQ